MEPSVLMQLVAGVGHSIDDDAEFAWHLLSCSGVCGVVVVVKIYRVIVVPQLRAYRGRVDCGANGVSYRQISTQTCVSGDIVPRWKENGWCWRNFGLRVEAIDCRSAL